MGYMRHHGIVVTGCDPNDSAEFGEPLRKAHEMACSLFPLRVSAILPSAVNTYGSFFIAPDGSKEGWQESDHGDRARAEFLSFVRSMRYEDGSSPLSWAELQYGDEELESLVTASSDDDYRERRAASLAPQEPRA